MSGMSITARSPTGVPGSSIGLLLKVSRAVQSGMSSIAMRSVRLSGRWPVAVGAGFEPPHRAGGLPSDRCTEGHPVLDLRPVLRRQAGRPSLELARHITHRRLVG